MRMIETASTKPQPYLHTNSPGGRPTSSAVDRPKTMHSRFTHACGVSCLALTDLARMENVSSLTPFDNLDCAWTLGAVLLLQQSQSITRFMLN
jgi:hypothetical protein